MILSFPHPLPDELFISVLGRYYYLYVIKNLATFNWQLFGHRAFSQSTILPCRLTHFVNATKSIFPVTADEIIERLTQFQYYRNFISEEMASLLKQKMINNGFANSSSFIGLNSSKLIGLKQLMYCPICFVDDTNKYDQAYFHRIHQLLIPVCKIHNVKLYSYVPDVLNTNPQQPPILNDQTELNFIPAENTNKLFNNLLDMAVDLLEGKRQLNINKTYYQEQLYKLGFYRGSTLNHEKIIAFINATINQNELDEMLKLTKENDCVKSFYSSALYRPGKTINPLKHLFLNYIIQQLSSQTSIHREIKQNEACLNKLCDAFLKPNTLTPNTKYDSKLKLQVQHFRCHCGMSFKKYLKQQKDQTFILKKKIIKYGDNWESSLLNLFKNKQSYYSIGKTLGVNHNVAKRMILKLVAKDKGENQSNNYKALWCKALEENNFSIREARKTNSKIYKWLFRNEHQWLLAENKKHKKVNNNEQLRINWVELDNQLNRQIQKNYNQLIQRNYPKTITKSLLFRTVKSFRAITKTKEIHRLPLTVEFVESVVENKVNFQRRKLAFAVEKIKLDYTSFSRSRILTTAKIRKLETSLEPELSRIINNGNT